MARPKKYLTIDEQNAINNEFNTDLSDSDKSLHVVLADSANPDTTRQDSDTQKPYTRPSLQERSFEESFKLKNGAKRKPLYLRRPLGANGDPNYHYRWFADQNTRIQEALDGGYEFENEKQENRDKGFTDASNLDTRVSRTMGKTTSYLMKIPKELWLHDQEEKWAKNQIETKKQFSGETDFGKKIGQEFYVDKTSRETFSR